MTLDELKAVFKSYEDEEYLKFDRIENKLTNRPDLHAFILLDKLVPTSKGTINESEVWKGQNIVAGAERDELWLAVSPEVLANVVTEAQLIELIRCGVRYGIDDINSFAMFV